MVPAHNFKDLTGLQFGRLVVISQAEKTADNRIRWACMCNCGNTCIVQGSQLTTGKTKSCGCIKTENCKNGNLSRTHGQTKTRLYRIWSSMKQRCYYSRHKSFQTYGGRGIQVCDEWLHSFEAFRDWALANGYKDDLTIDRKDPNGNYCPDNCRWETAKQQVRNRRNTRTILYQGKTKSIAEWAEITGISAPALIQRIEGGWSPEKALETPYKERRKPCN